MGAKTKSAKTPLALIRATLGLSQVDFAREMGVSASMVASVEAGSYRSQSWKLPVSLTERLRLSHDESQSVCSGSISKPRLARILRRLARRAKGVAA